MIQVERAVTTYLNNLIDILVEEEYLGFHESAEKYVNDIYDFIYDKVSYTLYRETKSEYAQMGMYYVVYKANKRTTWLLFFEKNKERILVTHVINNHSSEYAQITDI